MAPLRREWEQVKADADQAYAKLQESVRAGKKSPALRSAFEKILIGFLDRLTHIKILDPSCGSGNFLYVAIKLLLDLEKEVITYGANRDFSSFPHVEPTQLLGIEINPYAQQLAQIVIWIGYLQWLRQNGFGFPAEPILKPFENIKRMDAIIDLTDPANPKEPEWPDADFIVGNPPFLGGNRVRSELSDEYVNRLFSLYDERVPAFSDLCCYWFEKARTKIESGHCKRAGLLATQGIRGGVNREVLKRIKESGDIFFGISDRDWIIEGASVHVSMAGFDDGLEKERLLDGRKVSAINANLTAGVDVTQARPLPENEPLHIEGVKKGADFELPNADAVEAISSPNPDGRANSDVVRLYFNGTDLINERDAGWIIYFPASMLEGDAALYDAPFSHVKRKVFPVYGSKRKRWWIDS